MFHPPRTRRGRSEMFVSCDRTSNECPQRVHFCETFGGGSVDFEKLNFGL